MRNPSISKPCLGKVILRQHEHRVEIYIDRGDKAQNEALFDFLYASRDQIEGSYGGELDWQRMDEMRACRVSVPMAQSGYRDESDWERIQESLIAMMKKFEPAVMPALEAGDKRS